MVTSFANNVVDVATLAAPLYAPPAVRRERYVEVQPGHPGQLEFFYEGFASVQLREIVTAVGAATVDVLVECRWIGDPRLPIRVAEQFQGQVAKLPWPLELVGRNPDLMCPNEWLYRRTDVSRD